LVYDVSAYLHLDTLIFLFSFLILKLCFHHFLVLEFYEGREKVTKKIEGERKYLNYHILAIKMAKPSINLFVPEMRV
jgi:hypothetical protein